MNKIDPWPNSSDPSTPVADVAGSSGSKYTPDKREAKSRRGRSVGYLILAIMALAAVVAAGLSFGWKGWLTASLGGISILLLLPCVIMCGGVIWMLVRGARGG